MLPDGVSGPQTNPLGNGAVLLLGFGKLLLGTERFMALFYSDDIEVGEKLALGP